MRVAVTGADGFLGWHVRCAALARHIEVLPIDRDTLNDAVRLDSALTVADGVVHLAGVNRASDEELSDANHALARILVAALERVGRVVPVVFANSIHGGSATPFGEGKERAASSLNAWGGATGAVVVDVRLPNIFGEHGRPFYNSVFATFSHQLATSGGAPVVVEDRMLSLLSAQDAADLLLDALSAPRSGQVHPQGRATSVSDLLLMLTTIDRDYRDGMLPQLSTEFEVSVFNAFRSYCYPDRLSAYPLLRSDERGSLFECVKLPMGGSQVFFSSTEPGFTRGNHFHRRKIERFAVVSGEGVIRMRRMLDERVIEIPVDGRSPALVDMPTLWAHSIENTGASPLHTLFWTNELFDPDSPDTFYEPVLKVELGR